MLWPIENQLPVCFQAVNMAVPLSRDQKLGLMQLYDDIEEELLAKKNYEIDQLNARRRGQILLRPQKKQRAYRSCAARAWLTYYRGRVGQYKLLMQNLQLHDPKAFRNYIRMCPEMFYYLVSRLEGRLKKQRTHFKEPLSPGHRLALALRYFAGGDMYMSLEYSWFIAHNTISVVVKEVAEAIIAEFGEEYLSPPSTPEGWKKISDHFQSRWNFPHCIGALDGKHVAIDKPKNSCSEYYNYKKFFSVILMALVDADYKFIWVEAGCNGSCSDAQIWNDSDLQDGIKLGVAGLPDSEPLEGETFDLPYFIVGDDAFALREYLMKPFGHSTLTRQQRLFNYRLSRARRIVENAFGIMTQRFQCFHGVMRQEPKTVTSIVLACCILHNMLRDTDSVVQRVADHEDAEHNLIPGPWRAHALVDGEVEDYIHRAERSTQRAKKQREYLKTYVTSPQGSVEWQDRMI